MNMFEVKSFSEPGSSEFTKEQATYIFFRDLLEEMESNHGTLTHNNYRTCLVIKEVMSLLV